MNILSVYTDYLRQIRKDRANVDRKVIVKGIHRLYRCKLSPEFVPYADRLIRGLRRYL